MANGSLERIENFFKSEVRNAGRRIFMEEKVSSTQPSDTEVSAYVRGSTAIKVSLKLEAVESNTILADCSCADSQKERLCKHIFAVLLKVSEDHADFLEDKTEIVKTVTSTTVNPRAAAMKEKQKIYRKVQYQKQKLRKNEIKHKKIQMAELPALPPEVEAALLYFEKNGFTLDRPLNSPALHLARKQLSRVFHPDKGGSHSEFLELNGSFDVVMKYLNSISNS